MKKLLGSTLALAMFLPAGANAELLKNFKASGSIDVDAVSANNVTDLRTDKYDRINTVQTRVMVNADWDLLDDVHAKATLDKNDRTYGQASQSIHGVETATTFEQSYIKIDKLFGAVDTTLGRQFYGMAGDLIVYYGPRNDYGLTVTAVDGGRFDWNGEKVGVTVIGAKLPTASALGVKDTADKNLWGVDVHVKPMDNMSGAFALYYRNTINSGTPTGSGVTGNDHLWVADLKGKATMGGAWLAAEIAKDFGDNRTVNAGGYTFSGNYTGWAGKLNGGYKADLNNIGAVTGWGEAAVASGGQTSNRNFTAIAGDYRPGGIAGRFWSGSAASLGNSAVGAVDGASFSNRVDIGAGVKYTPAALNKLTAGVSWWNYRAQNATALQVASSGNTQGNKFLGNEYDLDLSWAHSENVTVSAGAGSFQPGRVYIVTNGSTINPATLYHADVAVKF